MKIVLKIIKSRLVITLIWITMNILNIKMAINVLNKYDHKIFIVVGTLILLALEVILIIVRPKGLTKLFVIITLVAGLHFLISFTQFAFSWFFYCIVNTINQVRRDKETINVSLSFKHFKESYVFALMKNLTSKIMF